MRILGLDPGIARCGWGVIEVRSAKCEVRNCGCIQTEKKEPLPIRLRVIYTSIFSLLKRYKPDVVVVEELFFNTNAKTALVVGQARGVVLLAAAIEKIPVASYTPLQVKMAMTSFGHAPKPQVGLMVKKILSLKEVPKPDDIADALAVALTHAFSYSSPHLSKE